jgi:hypothetical protein
MTYGPPPDNPPEQPGHTASPGGGYQTPQGGFLPPRSGYGEPTQYGSPYAPPPAPGAARSLNLAAVNRLDWGIFAVALLAFILSFQSFYTGSLTFGGLHASGNESAWHGFFGWFAVLLALAGAALVAVDLFVAQFRMQVSSRLVALVAYAVALLFMIIAGFVTPGVGAIPSGVHVSFGRGVGYWIDLVAIIAGLVLCYLRYRQTGGDLAALLGGRKAAGVPAGYPPQQYQPPQYQPPQYQSPQYQPPQYQPPQAYGAPQQYQDASGYQPPQPYQPPPPAQPGYQPGQPAYSAPPAFPPPAAPPPPPAAPPPPPSAPPPPPPAAPPPPPPVEASAAQPPSEQYAPTQQLPSVDEPPPSPPTESPARADEDSEQQP